MVVLIENGILFGLRLVLFFSCRKYLLRSLYSDLQHLSLQSQANHASAVPSTPSEELDEIQLGSIGSLPTPSTHGKTSRKGLGRIFGMSSKRTKHPTHSSISRIVFAACFSESCMLFALLMSQALGVFDAGTRLFNWNFSLFLLLTTLLVFIPFLLSLLLVIASSSLPSPVPSALPTSASTTPNRGARILTPMRVVLTLLPVLLYLAALSRIPLPSGLATDGNRISILTASLARLVFVGTIILGLLSGIGAVSNSWKWVPLNRNEVEVTDRTIETAERAVERVRDDLRQRREEAKRRAGSGDSTDASTSWYARMVPNLRGGDDYAQEIKGLEALEYQMTLNLEDLVTRREEAKFGHTITGRLWNFGGRIFAVYCAIRVLSSIVNILIPKSLFTRSSSQDSSTTIGVNYPDLITKLLADVLSLVSANVDLDELARVARQVSLVLVGVIVLSSIRMVLRGVGRALKVTSRNLGASLMLLILAQLMGIYLLSTIVQMRNLFPPTVSESPSDVTEIEDPDTSGLCTTVNCQPTDTNLFLTIPPFEVFGRLFDWSFLCAAVVTTGVLWFRRRMRD